MKQRNASRFSGILLLIAACALLIISCSGAVKSAVDENQGAAVACLYAFTQLPEPERNLSLMACLFYFNQKDAEYSNHPKTLGEALNCKHCHK